MQTVPEQAPQIEAASMVLRCILGETLLALYLHGSAVSGGLRPQSDIDLLAVVERDLAEDQRSDLLKALLQLSGRHPAAPGSPRCLEVVVFRLCDLMDLACPARAEFVYGEWMRDSFEAGERSLPARDPEYVLLLAQARREAVPFFGPHAQGLLPDVPREHVRRVMRNALPGLLGGLHGDERNVLLTLARMWRTARTEAFVPKDEAAAWAVSRLHDEDAATLDHARRAYIGEVADDWSRRRHAAQRLAARLAEHVSRTL